MKTEEKFVFQNLSHIDICMSNSKVIIKIILTGQAIFSSEAIVTQTVTQVTRAVIVTHNHLFVITSPTM